MRFALAVTILSLVSWTSCSPINERWEVNRWQDEPSGKVSPLALKIRNDLKETGNSQSQPTVQPTTYNLRKGEYMCDGKLCMLKVGEVPKGCPRGMCQIRIA